MGIRNNILRDVNDNNRIYFINLSNGIKVELIYFSDNKSALLLRGEIEKEDIQRAKEVVDLSKLRNNTTTMSKKEIIGNLELLCRHIREDDFVLEIYPELKSLEIRVNDYTKVMPLRS